MPGFDFVLVVGTDVSTAQFYEIHNSIHQKHSSHFILSAKSDVVWVRVDGWVALTQGVAQEEAALALFAAAGVVATPHSSIDEWRDQQLMTTA